MATVNNTAMDTGVVMFFKLAFSVPLDIQVLSEVEQLGQKEDLFLIFSGISIVLSTVATPVGIPINSAQTVSYTHLTLPTIQL